MPAYDRVVGEKPPPAYESAKTAAATPIPTATLRATAVCSVFTLASGKAATVTTVSGGLTRLLAFAVVAGAVFVLPPAALADCGGKPSAVNVYKECLSSGGGGKPTSNSHPKSQPSSGPTSSPSSTPVHISKQTTKALKKAGKDGKSLSYLVKGYGASRLLQSSSSAPAAEPTAVASAFDLGSGPTALLIILAGTAVLLLGVTGFRTVRQRRD
jgi:hypothetical protein